MTKSTTTNTTMANNSIYGSDQHMHDKANAVYKVTSPNGSKATYYMYEKLVNRSGWLGPYYVKKGWICVIVPEDVMQRTVTYEYPELELKHIEETWFRAELGIKNYNQVKYMPYEIKLNSRAEVQDNDDDDDYLIENDDDDDDEIYE